MADKFKDADDRWLESMLRDDTIADNGFTDRVVGRLRRRIWLRRWVLPLAMFIGGVIAIKPATELLGAILKVVNLLPANLVRLPDITVLQMPVVPVGVAVLAIAVLFFRMLEE
ncbi:MAG: hypothetical protein KJO82_14940 [Gammaproteobacteria bacterium]|nr:hypothetical protein [Gammaproteobacteria bacterium]